MSYHEREYRHTRYRDEDPSSDDEKYKSTTVRRYKVGGGGGAPTRVERVDRFEEVEDDRRSKYSYRDDYRDSRDLLEVDRRVEKTYLPERPRSAFDPPTHRTVVEKRVVERDGSDFRDRGRDDRYRVVEREVDYSREPERRDRVVRETRETIERDAPLSPRGDRDWDRRSRATWDDRDDVRIEKRVERRSDDHVDDVRIEKRVERRSDDHIDDVKIEKRVERIHDHHDYHDHPGEVEHYRKETEYYAPADPPPQPIVIRQRTEPQQIIVQEAPPPPPVVIDRKADPGYIVLRENNREVTRRDPREEEYYYRREERRDDDYAMERYDRRRREYPSDEEDVYVKRTVIRRERSASSDHHRKRHIAEGALAGAGLSAIISSRRDRDGELPEHRGRKVLAGAALGALGTEVIRRAKSAYEDRYGDEDDYDDRRHRSRSKSRSRLATGLAIGAAALAVAGGLKYMQSNKIEKEEATRGRSRRRYSDDGYSRSRSGSTRKRSKSNMAKAAVATGAIAGLVQHYRSKSRGASRSKSRLRTGAEIAAAGLTGAAASKLWERHKEKQAREHARDVDDEYYSDRDGGYSPSRSRSRSRNRSRARSFSSREHANPELGLVEYGATPLSPSGYDSASEDRRHRHRHRSASVASDQEAKRKRSKSRLREAAAGVLGAGAAAIGLKKYNDAKKEREKSRERDARDRSEERREADEKKEARRRDRRSRDRERRRYEEQAEAGAGGYYSDYDPEAPPSPPTASGGAFYPPQQPNQSTLNLNAYPPHNYNPQDYADFPPPPPGPPPQAGPSGHQGPGGPIRPDGHYPPTGPENVSRQPVPGDNNIPTPPQNNVDHRGVSAQDGIRDGHTRNRSPDRPHSRASSISTVLEEPPHYAKSVSFIPLSPQSSRTLRKLHESHENKGTQEIEDVERDDPTGATDLGSQVARRTRPAFYRRRSDSDPSSDRPGVQRRRQRRNLSPLSDDDDIEVLPDRFDAAGHPLDPGDPRRWTTRRGEFEYRPRHKNGSHVQGAWGIGGTDPEMVNRMAEGFGQLLQSRQGWVGVLGNVLSTIQGPNASGRTIQDNENEDEDTRRRRRRYKHRHDDYD
ncbi:hypothetical protein BX600DRAFT_510005 [Xylariales sp. PMI_506]|nr:hypothetical protein BX600DRAFT_510005 [Xylariales sp. PMI_506]